MKSFLNLTMRPQSEEILTPFEFISLTESERSNIKSTQIIPPKLGSKHFGRIKIIKKTPTYAFE